ncbi:MAG TPA: DUF554 domain-containing protein [Actinomycetota bacterium]|nr:DUF554 domain-containing protein [Actinomycetota bacterium]
MMLPQAREAWPPAINRAHAGPRDRPFLPEEIRGRAAWSGKLGAQVRGLGTLANLATVATGGMVGVFIGDRLPSNMRRTILQGLGLVVLAVAVVGLEPLFHPTGGLRRFIVMIVALIAGGIVGEALGLSARLESLGARLRDRFGVKDDGNGRSTRGRFVEGFVVASTIFCVGPLTILGAIQDGLGQSIRLLAIKSALDGVAAMGFASVYGWGVIASLLTILVYQGLVTIAAALIAPLMTAEVLAQLGAVGSLLVMGIGFRLLDIAQVEVVNLLPALLFAPLLAAGLAAIT